MQNNCPPLCSHAESTKIEAGCTYFLNISIEILKCARSNLALLCLLWMVKPRLPKCIKIKKTEVFFLLINSFLLFTLPLLTHWSFVQFSPGSSDNEQAVACSRRDSAPVRDENVIGSYKLLFLCWRSPAALLKLHRSDAGLFLESLLIYRDFQWRQVQLPQWHVFFIIRQYR